MDLTAFKEINEAGLSRQSRPVHWWLHHRWRPRCHAAWCENLNYIGLQFLSQCRKLKIEASGLWGPCWSEHRSQEQQEQWPLLPNAPWHPKNGLDGYCFARGQKCLQQMTAALQHEHWLSIGRHTRKHKRIFGCAHHKEVRTRSALFWHSLPRMQTWHWMFKAPILFRPAKITMPANAARIKDSQLERLRPQFHPVTTEISWLLPPGRQMMWLGETKGLQANALPKIMSEETALSSTK